MLNWTLGAADLAVGVTLIVTGLMVVTARKERRIGWLLLIAAASWFAGTLWSPFLFLHRGPMVHLHLSYPSGILRRRLAIVATAAAYVWAVIEGWVFQPAATAALAVLMAVAAIDGYRNTTGPARRAATPGFVAASMFAGILLVSSANLLFDVRADLAIALAYDGVIAFVAIWLTVDLLRGRWTEATLADLVTQLGGGSDNRDVEAKLRRALGDPSLAVGYWNPRSHSYRDRAGEQVPQDENTIFVLDDDGSPLAALHHDPALARNPALLEGASNALKLVASNIRLRAQITQQVDQLATARRRIVEAADEQRRMLQAEITEGPKVALFTAASALARSNDESLADSAALIAGIAQARNELDRFSAGVGPALHPDGLRAAVDQLATRAGLPVIVTYDCDQLTPAVESTLWFVCAEALANAAKHAHATQVWLAATRDEKMVTVDVIDDGVGGADADGTGLRGLADRVSALGGSLIVAEASPHGTHLSVSIPTEV